MKKAFYVIMVAVLLSFNSMGIASAALGSQPVTVEGGAGTVDTLIQQIVNTAMGFLGILAVLYALYGGFKILTAGGEEEGVTKGKTVLVQALLGLLVIFLANAIVQWMITIILK